MGGRICDVVGWGQQSGELWGRCWRGAEAVGSSAKGGGVWFAAMRCKAERAAARGLCWRAEAHVGNTRGYTRPLLPPGYASVDQCIYPCEVVRGPRTLHMDGDAGVLFTTVSCVYSPACGDVSP